MWPSTSSPVVSMFTAMIKWIYGTMQYLRPDIQIALSMVRPPSVAAVLLGAGAPGKRFAPSNSRILIHQPWRWRARVAWPATSDSGQRGAAHAHLARGDPGPAHRPYRWSRSRRTPSETNGPVRRLGPGHGLIDEVLVSRRASSDSSDVVRPLSALGEDLSALGGTPVDGRSTPAFQ